MSYDSVVSLGDEELETLEAVRKAQASVAAERSPLVAIGLLGNDTSVDLAAAAAAYAAGHLGESRAQAGEAVALIEGAGDVGTQRAAVGGGVGLAAVVLGVGFVVVVRRRRRAGPAPTTSILAGPSAAGSLEAPATLAARTEPAEDEEGT